ncbi:C40 family peptidase [Nocardia thraciensis]
MATTASRNRITRLLFAALTGLLAVSALAGTAVAATGSGGTGSSSGSGSGSGSGSASGSANLPIPSPRAQIALGLAQTQAGKPYVWGATGPDTYDCSGLALWAFRQVGIMLPRTTWQQAEAGSAVPLGALQPGDIVVVNNDGSHEGIYAGGGQLLNAHSPGVGVVMTPLSEFEIYAIRRFY